jgi:hypothetical protein
VYFQKPVGAAEQEKQNSMRQLSLFILLMSVNGMKTESMA